MFPENEFENMVKSKADDIFGSSDSSFTFADIKQAEENDRMDNLKEQIRSYVIIRATGEFDGDIKKAALYIQMRKKDHLNVWYVQEQMGNHALSAENQVLATAEAALFTDVKREIWRRIRHKAEKEME